MNDADLIESAQRILDGKWRHARAALDACRRGAWAAFVSETAPERPLLVGRIDFRRCLSLAQATFSGPSETTLSIVPLWACSTEDGESDEWVAVHGIAREGEPLTVQEVGPFIGVKDASPRADVVWACRVRQWKAATVVDGRSYAPSVPMLLRSGAFAVLELEIVEVVAVKAIETKAFPRPTRMVPEFANWFEPRAEVPAERAKEIAAMCFTAEEDS